MAKARAAGKRYCPRRCRDLAFQPMTHHGIALAVLFLACGDCHDGSPAQTSASATPPASAGPATGPTVVRAEDDGKSFDIARGDTLTFELATGAGTGYAWAPTQVDALALAQQGDRASEVSSDLPGAPKMDVYRFKANRSGSTTVEMSLRRPFGSAPPVRTIRVTIHVR
jgi:predicted secreted protein